MAGGMSGGGGERWRRMVVVVCIPRLRRLKMGVLLEIGDFY